jgi:predicted anti-sigma-YlaC factor YlaD
VTNETNDRHLSSELMQAFLDGETSSADSARVSEHASVCQRCHSEMEAWRTLFGELGELGEIVPGPTFRERVLRTMAPVEPLRDSLAVRVTRRLVSTLRGAAGMPPSAPRPLHPLPERMQDFLEGLRPRGEAMAIEGHLHACRDCRDEASDWRGVLAGLDAMPSFAPAAEFQERVMAHVRVQIALAWARPTLKERVHALANRVPPRTKRRFAAFAGAAVTPLVLLGLVAWTVFSRPLATLGNLFSFLGLRVSDWLVDSFGGTVATVSGSATVLRLFEALALLGDSPAAAAVTVAGLAALSLAATWVLYRNVIAPHSVDRIYVH